MCQKTSWLSPRLLGKIFCELTRQSWTFWKSPLHKRTIIPTVTYGGGIVMIWGCFAGSGPRRLAVVVTHLRLWDYQAPCGLLLGTASDTDCAEIGDTETKAGMQSGAITSSSKNNKTNPISIHLSHQRQLPRKQNGGDTIRDNKRIILNTYGWM